MRRLVRSCLLLLTVTGAAPAAPEGAAHPGLERHRTARPSLTLLRPAAWSVRAETSEKGLRVTVTDPEEVGQVELDFAVSASRTDAPAHLAALCRELGTRHPDLVVTHASTCRDGTSCATATVAYRAGGAELRGLLHVDADPGILALRRIVARADRFESQRKQLLAVLASIRLEASPDDADVEPLEPRQAADRSVEVSLPAGWKMQAQEGKLLATAPDASAGLVATAFPSQLPGLGQPAAPGVLISPYRPPEQLIQGIWERWGNRETRVVRSSPDRVAAAGCAQRFGRRCDAADLELAWLSPRGTACTGAFKVLATHPGPTGEWLGTVAGVWGRSEALGELLSTLEAAVASLTVPDRRDWGATVESLTRLKAIEARTQRTLQVLHDAVARSQREHERWTEPRWDGTLVREVSSPVLQRLMESRR
jgi:hypothetical protein